MKSGRFDARFRSRTIVLYATLTPSRHHVTVASLPKEFLDKIYGELTIDDCGMVQRSCDEECLQKYFGEKLSLARNFSQSKVLNVFVQVGAVPGV